jgi:hypothetical protein
MRLRLSILLATALSLAGSVIPARAQNQQPANPPATNSAPDGKPADKPATPPKKSPKVIDNDDIAGKGKLLFPHASHSGIDLSGINDCDRNCFERVRTAAGILAGADVQWKRDLLDGIDKIREDEKWQTALLELANVKGNFCDLQEEKNEDLARHSDPKNVTPEEIAIDEEYQRKFQAAQQDLMDAMASTDTLIRAYRGIGVRFMAMQKDRIVTAYCQQQPQRPMYRPHTDNSDDP